MREPRRRPWLSIFRVAVILPIVLAAAAYLGLYLLVDNGLLGKAAPPIAAGIIVVLGAWLVRCPRCAASILAPRGRHEHDKLFSACRRCGLSFQTHTYWTPFHSRDKREA